MARQPLINNKTLLQEMLLLKRQQMGEANRRKSVKPSKQPWIYPRNIERRYGRNITAWIKQITDQATLDIATQLESWIAEYNLTINKTDSVRLDAYPQELTVTIDRLKGLAEKAAGDDLRLMVVDTGYDVSEQNLKQWGKFTEAVVGVKFFPVEAWETEVVNAWAQTNYNLITSLSDEYIKKVNLIVSEGVQGGQTWDEIMRSLKKTNRSFTTGNWKVVKGKKVRAQSRAELIARDQVGKLNEQFTMRRQTEAGIDMYTWLTAGDERVRPTHKVMNGKLCRWDDATVYSDDNGKTWKKRSSIGGVEKHPGQDIQCRCTSIPFFEEAIKEVDEIIKPIVKKPIVKKPIVKKPIVKKPIVKTKEKVNLNKAELKAIDEYTSKENVIKNKKTLESAIDKLPVYKGTVYRGMKIQTIDAFESFMEQSKKGGVLNLPNFTSTSIEKGVASEFGGGFFHDINLKIASKKGRWIGDLGINPEEKEVLFKPNSKFAVKKVERSVFTSKTGSTSFTGNITLEEI